MVSFLFNEINLKHLSPGFKSIRVGFGQGLLCGGFCLQEAPGDSVPTSLTLSWGQFPPAPTTARAGDLPAPIHMQKNPKSEGLLDLISCCALCKIRIMPSPSQKEKAGVGGGVGVGRKRRRAGPGAGQTRRHLLLFQSPPATKRGAGLLSPQTCPPWACLQSAAFELQVVWPGSRGAPAPHPRRGSGFRGPPRPGW